MPKESANMLVANNCNKAMCKSCIFKTDGNQFFLRPERLEEIKARVLTDASHICHVTEKTCYGALQYQADVFFKIGWIKEDTVECFLQTVADTLKLPMELFPKR